MSTLFNYGSDGGNFEYGNFSINGEIGYTDGCPFQSATSLVPSYDPNEKICGYTYGYMGNRGEYRSPQGVASQQRLYDLGVNWICLAVANYQTKYYSTDIHADYLKTPTDRDIASVVERAHKRGIKVCLKPMVNTEDGVWRAHIGFPDLHMGDMDYYWKKWFISYKNFLLHYAELAQELKCEMLCIGCEMIGTEHRKYDWLYLIEQVRRVYTGKIVYNANHDRENAEDWFKELDYIGTSAYYPVGQSGVNEQAMRNEWVKVRDRLNRIAEVQNKKYIFMEVGCRSAKGSSIEPWDFTKFNEFNEHEQALYYSTCMDVFKNEVNFAGVFWWDWPTILPDQSLTKSDLGYGIYNKEAEKILTKIYKGMVKGNGR